MSLFRRIAASRAIGPALVHALVLVLGVSAIAQEDPKKGQDGGPAGRLPPDGRQAPAEEQGPAERKGAPLTVAERIREAAKARYRFAEWPGKDGPSKDGIDLARLTDGFETASGARIDLRALPDGPVATLGADEGRTRAVVWIEETPAQAHEALLSWLASSTRPFARLEGKETVGEVSFGVRGEDSSSVAFARANVAVAVIAPTSVAPVLASRIDGKIAASPVLDGKRRRTEAGARLVRSVAVMGGIDATDYFTLDGQGILAREVRAEGGHAFECDDSRIRMRWTPNPAEEIRISVHLLSTRGWRTVVTKDMQEDERRK